MFLYNIGDDLMITYYTHTEDYIKKLYLELGITKPLDLKINVLAAHFDITVFYWPEDSRALFAKKKAFILINEHLSMIQKRQDFFHEFSHVLTHAGSQRTLPKAFVDYQEYKANHFMYHAAVPSFMLDELEINDATEFTITLIQHQFNVDYDFACKRLTNYLNRKRDILYWNMLVGNNLLYK